jgi:PAS domain S-box-containing protein
LLLCFGLGLVVAASSLASELVGMLWLPSGAATVLSAVGGRRARLGAVTAVLVVEAVWLPQVVTSGPGVLALMLAGIGMGTYTQLVLAARLMAPLVTGVGLPGTADEARGILRFLLAAVLPGAVSALLFTALVPLSGNVSIADLPAIALLWWLGDAAAALVAAPAVAAHVGQPAVRWRPRRTPALIAALIGWTGLLFTFAIVEGRREASLAADWREYADELGNRVFNTIENAAELAHGLGTAAVMAAESGAAGDAASADLDRYAALHNTGDDRVELLAWAPRATDGFRLRSGSAAPGARAWRDARLDAEPGERGRLAAAVQAGQPMLHPAPSALAPADRPMVAVYVPVYRGGVVPETPAARDEGLLGVVLALVETPLSAEGAHVYPETVEARLVVTDHTSAEPFVVLDRVLPDSVSADRSQRLSHHTRVAHATTFAVYGRRWNIEASGMVVTSLFEPAADWMLVTIISAILSALLDALLLMVTGRESIVREVVARRTLALETIRDVQGRFIAGTGAAMRPDPEPILAAVRSVTGARSVHLEQCGPCHLSGSDACPPGEADVTLPLRHRDAPLGCLHIRGITRPEGLDDARALAGTAAALLGAADVARARQSAEARFHAFMAYMPAVVLMKSEAGEIVYTNPAFERLLLPPGVTAVGKRNEDVFPPEVAAHLNTIDERLWRTGEALSEEIYFDPPGGRIYLHSYTFIFEGADGARYLAGIGHDVTVERRQAETLAGNLREKEALLKEIHHRVKNNLQIVSSLLNLQRPEVTDPAVRAFVDDSRNRIRSIALLHETLYQGENLARIDFPKYVRFLTAHLQRALGGAAGAVTLDVEVGEVRVGIDQAIPCGLIINELVSNAFKYAFPEGRAGTIRVRVTSQESTDGPAWTDLTVADDGVGMSAPFEARTSASLGLRLVHDLTAQLGGRIVLSSTPEGGTTVEIRFRCV